MNEEKYYEHPYTFQLERAMAGRRWFLAMAGKKLGVLLLILGTTLGGVASLQIANAMFGPQLGEVLGLTTQLAQLSPDQSNSLLIAQATNPSTVPASSSGTAQPKLQVNIPAVFKDLVTLSTLIIEEGSVFEGQAEFVNDVILGGNLTGPGSIINVGSGQVLASNLVYSVVAGSGIEVSGEQDLTITNTDLGSAQKIFGKIKVGSDTATAGSNTDTFEIAQSGAITLSLDTSNKKLTIGVESGALGDSGFTDDGTVVRLTTSSDSVGIGTTSPSTKLHVIGVGTFSGGIDAQSSGISNAGAVTGATGLTSSGTITFSSLSTGILKSNINGVLSSSAVNLAGGSSEVTGTLPVTNGGTGITSVVAGDLLYGTGVNTLAALGIGGDGEVLTVSGGTLDWATAGGGGPCATCLVNDPGSTQIITPSAAGATGLVVRQASGGSVDIFRVANNDDSVDYLRVDEDGNVILGAGAVSSLSNFTVAPSSTDPISISPVAQGLGAFTGTITSADLTAARTWTFPNASGDVCLSTGNCAGQGGNFGGSGTANYIPRFATTTTVENSIMYDTGTQIGIGTTVPGATLGVVGTATVSGHVGVGSGLDVVGAAHIFSILGVEGAVDFNSTLGVSGDTTLGAALDVTGNADFGGTVDIASHLAVDSNVLYVNTTTDRVGLGTTTPGAQLQVNAGSAATGGLIVKGFSGQSAHLTDWTNSSDVVLSYIDANGVFNGPIAGAVNPGFTTGSVVFQGASGLAQDNASFFWDDSTNRLGIGTAVPGSTLTVEGNIRLNATANGLLDFNGNNLIRNSAGTMSVGNAAINVASNFVVGANASQSFIRSSTTDLFISGAGLVGIGSTTPLGTLDVRAKLGTVPIASMSGATSFAGLVVDNFGLGDIFTASSSGLSRFVVKQNGNVGIGTTLPAALLDVGGNASISGNLVFNGTSLIQNTQNRSLTIGGDTTGNLLLRPVNGTGRVGINTTTPLFALQVNGQIFASTNGAAGSPNYIFAGGGDGQTNTLSGGIEGGNNSGGGNAYVRFGTFLNGSTTIGNYMAMTRQGNVGFGTTAPLGRFVVTGTANASGNAMAMFNESGSTNDIFTASSSGTSRFVITNAGNVGIGTSIPSSLLHIRSTTANSARLYVTETGDTTDSHLAGLDFYDGTTLRGGVYKTGSTHRISLWDATAERLSVLQGGNVAIGTTTALGKFHVSGAPSAGGNALAIFNQTNSDDILAASASGTNRFTVKNSGRLGINTSNPEGFVHIQRTTTSRGYSLDGNDTLVLEHFDTNRLKWVSNNTAHQLLSFSDQDNEDSGLISYQHDTNSMNFATNTTTALRIDSSQNVGLTSTLSFGTDAARVFAITSSTAPSTSITDGIQLFAVDQSGSHELRVRDEAGNVTTLSPHNFGLLEEGKSEDLAWAFYSERNGVAINADMTKALRIIEKLSGEKLVHIKNLRNGQDLSEFYSEQAATELQHETAEWVSAAELQPLAKLSTEIWTFVGKAVFEKPAEFIAEVTFRGRVQLADKDAAGYAVIRTGDDKVEVRFDKPFLAAPVVTVTPQAEVSNLRVESVSADSFTIKLSQPATQDVTINWVAVSVIDPRTIKSSGQPTLTPAATPSPGATPVAIPSPSPSPTVQPSPSSTPTPVASPSSSPSSSP